MFTSYLQSTASLIFIFVVSIFPIEHDHSISNQRYSKVLSAPTRNESRPIHNNNNVQSLIGHLPFDRPSQLSDGPAKEFTGSENGFVRSNYSRHSVVATTDTIGAKIIQNDTSRHKRNLIEQESNPDCEFTVSRKPVILAVRCDTSDVADDGAIIVKATDPIKVYLIGKNLYSNLSVALTASEGSPQDDCTHTDRVKSLPLYNISSNIAEVVIDIQAPSVNLPYYFCLREASSDARWFHQGSEPWLKIYVKADFLPFYMKIILIACLLGLSGLFSGLNLGLMALDKNELQVIMKCGSKTEKRYARAIEPVRRRGNYLLCSILFSNTLVNSTISVLLEELSSGLVAIMISTVLIVLFGEILPQAFCSRHGLAVGARTVGLTYFCMIVTFPLSYPVSYCLDLALGEEIGHAYDRERLMEFIRVTRNINNLEADEVNIISGALKLKQIQISEIMTRIEDVYMLDANAVLDFDTIQAVVEKGYSRVPVHETGNRENIVGVLFAKDLALVDPDDKTPVQTMISFYNHEHLTFPDNTTLDAALDEFKTGKSHMAIVKRFVDDEDRDPYWEIVGIVTMEDVIEEILQMEINDETDTLTDNRGKRRRKVVRKDFSQFSNIGFGDSSYGVVVSPQLCLAAYQFLSATVEPFHKEHISDTILKKLLSQRIYYKVRIEDNDAQRRLYTAGQPADYFILILEGRVHVTCGKENLFFDGGPFSFFGKDALLQFQMADLNLISNYTIEITSRRGSTIKTITPAHHMTDGSDGDSKMAIPIESNTALPVNSHEENYFTPDYTVDIVATTAYLKVTRNDYITARKATLIEEHEDNI